MRAVLFICTLILSFTAQAHHLGHNEALHMRQTGEILSAQQLLDQATESYPNTKLLEMKLKHKHGRYLYKLQLLHNSGRVQKLYYDAQSGELIREKNYED